MIEVRNTDFNTRFEIYRSERIINQQLWYTKKSNFNRNRATLWFIVTVLLHVCAILLLLFNILKPSLELPVEIVAVCISSVFTWLEAKKHNELSSSYSLTAHEITLLKAEVTNIQNDKALSEYIINCENAFSREHTQWIAKRNE